MTARRSTIAGLIAALFAIMAQLAVAGALPQRDVASTVLAGAPICHTDGGDETPAPPQPHPIGCPICPACAPLGVQAPLIGVDAALPVDKSPVVIVRAAVPPPATAPPAASYRPAQPRAPPVLS